MNGVRALIGSAARQPQHTNISQKDRLRGDTVEYKTPARVPKLARRTISGLRAASGFKMATRTRLLTNNVENNALAYDAAHREPHLPTKTAMEVVFCCHMLSSLPLLTVTRTLPGFLEMAYRSALAHGGADTCISSAARH